MDRNEMNRIYEPYGETDLRPIEEERRGRGARAVSHVRGNAAAYGVAAGTLALGAGAFLLARALRERRDEREELHSERIWTGSGATSVVTPEDRPAGERHLLDASGRPVEHDH